MGFQALNQGILTLKNPVMWIYPIISGLFLFAAVWFTLTNLTDFLGLRLTAVFFIFISPFFIAGTYAAVKTGDFSFNTYIKSAADGYFRIMLPCIVLIFAILLLMFMINVPLLFGQNAAFLSIISFIICVLLILPLFFFDTAAVIEDKKIFECLKRSFELTTAKPLEVILFYIVTLLLLFVFFMGFTIVWSALLAEEFEPLLTMTQSEVVTFSQDPMNLVELLGDRGILVTAVLSGITALLFALLFLPYKAIFYRDELMAPSIDNPYLKDESEFINYNGRDNDRDDVKSDEYEKK